MRKRRILRAQGPLADMARRAHRLAANLYRAREQIRVQREHIEKLEREVGELSFLDRIHSIPRAESRWWMLKL